MSDIHGEDGVSGQPEASREGLARPAVLRGGTVESTRREARPAPPEPLSTRGDATWDLKHSVRRAQSSRLLAHAIGNLPRRFPEYSAHSGLTHAQKLGLASLFALVVICLLLAPFTTLRTLAALGTLFFGLVVALRVAACAFLIVDVPARFFNKAPERQSDDDLPVYTLLVPLFREANVLPGLVRALEQLDYPALGSKRTSLD